MSKSILSLVVITFTLGLGAIAHAADGDPAASSAASATPGVVNINSATAEELSYLPGVGPARAQAIVAQRQKQKFARKEQLLNVSGIGPKSLSELRPYVALDGPTTLRHKVSRHRGKR